MDSRQRQTPPHECSDQEKKWQFQAPLVGEMQCTRAGCSPGCLGANVAVAAGVFLFGMRGRSLGHQLWRAKAEIQSVLTSGERAREGHRVTVLWNSIYFLSPEEKGKQHWFYWPLPFNGFLLQLYLWHLKTYYLLILMTSNRPRSSPLLPNLAKHLWFCQIYSTCLESRWVPTPPQRRGGRVWSFLIRQQVINYTSSGFSSGKDLLTSGLLCIDASAVFRLEPVPNS